MQLLEKLINAYGVSGNEGEVRNIIAKEIRKYVDDVRADKMGNLITRKRGRAPKVMLVAHMDEIGLMVKNIHRDGTMSVVAVGGIEPMILIGQRVHVKTKKGKIHGVITTKLLSDDHEILKLPDMPDLIVDTGLNKKELERKGVSIGDYLPLEQEAGTLGSKNIISGKALDDRIGCYILIEVAKKIKNLKHEVYFVFTVQEEVGLYGAKTSTYAIEPDWAIAVDTTNANDLESTPDITKRIGGGPCITIKDEEMISNQHITAHLKQIARRKKIPVQLEVSDFGTTDAMNVSISKSGVLTSVVSIPVRNLHSTMGVAHKSDINNAIKLLVELLKNPPKVLFT